MKLLCAGDPVADVGQAPLDEGSEPDEVDRLQALEQQVRQLTSRLAGWVEAQLVQSLDDRRNDMKALRSELQILLNEQLAGMRAEASSVLSVATRRLEVGQEQMAERLDAVAERAADAAAKTIALGGSSSVEADRLAMLEQHFSQRLAELREQTNAALATVVESQQGDAEMMRAEVTSGLTVLAGLPSAAEATEERLGVAMVRLGDSFEARLAEVEQARQSELDALRAELQTRLDERVSDLDEFERRVKAAMGRLTDSVEAKLAETVATRESDLDALRTDLTSRIDDVERALGRAAEGLPALQLSVLAGAERTDTLERETKAALAGVSASLDTRLGELSATRDAALEALRSEMADAAGSVSERLDALGSKASTVADEVSALRTEAEAGTTRTNELEQRVKAAVGRLAESVENRLGEFATARSAEIDVATSAMRARVAQVQERIDTVEQDYRAAADRVDRLVESKLAEIVERRRDELEAVKAEMQEALSAQLREARSDIGVVVADAHRRFVVSVDQLEERMHVVAEQATAAWTAAAGVETLEETILSDGRRIEALETHTRRTDARLGDVVDAKLDERAGQQGTQLDEVRDELRAAVDNVQARVTAALEALPGEVGARMDGLQGQMRAALDAHLAETRAEVTLALSEGRTELAAGAEQLEALQLALDQQSTKAVAGLAELRASVEAELKKGEAHLARTVQARLAESDAVVARLADTRTELDASLASVNRKMARIQDGLQKKLSAVGEQVAALAKAGAAEAGSLAPLRSDLRMLQGQVAELVELVSDLRPKRRVAAAPAKKVAAAPAKKAPAKKAPAKKAAADSRRKRQ